MDPDAFQILWDSSGTQPMLPSVKEVRWTWECNAPPLLHIVMGPQTIQLNLRLISQYTSLHSPPNFLSNISSRSPFLRHVTVMSTRLDNTEIAITSAAICEWDCLRTLRVIGLSSTALAHVATLPSLRVLEFGDVSHDELPMSMVIFPSIKGHGFSVLQRLSIIIRNLAFVTSPIGVMDQCLLREFKINLMSSRYPSPAVTKWKELFSARKGHCAVHLLTSLTTVVYAFLGSDIVISLDTIQALLAFLNLTNVNLPFHNFTLDNSDIVYIAKAWSRIGILTLHSSIPSTLLTRVTLSGLLPLQSVAPISRV